MPRRTDRTWQELTELVAAWEVFVSNLHLSDDPYMRTTVNSYASIMSFYRKTLVAGIDGAAWPKGMMAGLRQGSREIFPLIGQLFRSHPEVISAIRQAGGESLKLLLDYSSQVEKMIKRGKIRNEDEYYTARARLDDIEGNEVHRVEVHAIYSLLDRFEAEGATRV